MLRALDLTYQERKIVQLIRDSERPMAAHEITAATGLKSIRALVSRARKALPSGVYIHTAYREGYYMTTETKVALK